MSSKVILIGPPGSGKSTVGKVLAKELKLGFMDTDAQVAKLAGKSISDIFVEEGEAKFRSLERDAVMAALSSDVGVVALGGGAILNEEIFRALEKEPRVVYLEVSISNAAPRVGFNTDRPLLVGNPRQQWLKLFEARREKYEHLGKIRISTNNKKPKEVVAEIVGALQ
jgi:shikimate kinase